MSAELHMLRLRFETPRLYELGRRRHLPVRETDVGYLLHCALKELFGEAAPAPFALSRAESRHLEVLAYSRRGAAELRDHARAFADPNVYGCCDLDALEGNAKRMPESWPDGVRLGFRVRACPIVRMSSDGPRWRKGAEVDAFLARCWKEEGRPVDREAVYREWMARELESRGAQLLSLEIKGFQRQRVVRRNHATERKSHVSERPDAMLDGILRIVSGRPSSHVVWVAIVPSGSACCS
jgi:CRISPR system Cascade subunit CasE